MGEISDTDLSPNLPLRLIPSENIPPAPNSSESSPIAAVDWLPDFSGHSWVAYGASSLLVISHFPSPLHTLTGPVFRQVFNLSSPFSGDVASVSWSPVFPSSGDLAACAGNRVFVFQYDSTLGSFCWSQTAVLLQSAKVDVIAWTGSGDGIISGGTEVLLWKRNIKSWEIAWKFRMEVSQALLSTSCSIEGPSAAAAYPIKCPAEGQSLATCNASHCVSVFQSDGKSGYVTTELQHPQPVVALQWRPSGGSQLSRDTLYTLRHVLLTSCLDGAVRLWTEIDGSKTRKSNKDNRDPLASRRSFCVVAVIEINQSLDGTLGSNIFVNWALEMEGLACMSDEDDLLLSSQIRQNDEVGRCEWLIGHGSGKMLTFWAVHCLDDITTMRSPRVTLWKRLEIQGTAWKNIYKNDYPTSIEGFHFQKAAMWRNRMFGPPNVFSLVQLWPCNTLVLSVLHSQASLNKEGDECSHKYETCNTLSCQSEGILDIFGHTGKIVQVAVHPFKSGVQLAVSLDSNGLLIFWSICINPNSISSLPVLHPSWQIIGKITLPGTIFGDMRLYWAPSLVDEDRILLIGHVQGIDILIIKSCETEGEKLLCHKLGTVPFVGHVHMDVPDEVISVPVQSTSELTSKHVQFLLLVVWKKNCLVESWKVTLYSDELPGSCCQCGLNPKSGESSSWVCKDDFAGKTYSVAVDRCSSYLPDVHDQITSVAMVSPSISTPSLLQKLDQVNDSFLNNFPYHMATGHSDGMSRLWRINLSETSGTNMSIELVGMFNALPGPISSIAVADSGQKVATICSAGQTNDENMLCVWEPLHLAGAGTFELEDKICLIGSIVSLRWFLLQNILFLGVCFQNELQIYCRRVCSMQTLLNMRKSSESIWVRIATLHTSPTICNFVLGPRETIIIVYEKFFGLFGQWSFDGHMTSDGALSLSNGMDKDNPPFLAWKVHTYEELLDEKNIQGSFPIRPLTKAHNDMPSCLPANGTQPIENLEKKFHYFKLIEVAEKICGPLPFYHPELLWMNIFSGNWKRAYVAVCHLLECVALNPAIQQRPSPAKSSLLIRQFKLSDYYEGQLSYEVGQGYQGRKDLNTTTWSSHSEGGLMQFADNVVHNALSSLFSISATSSEACGYGELLEKLCIFDILTDSQKKKMSAIINLLREISNSQSASAYESLDESGRRFWCAIRLQQLDFCERNSRMPMVEELVIDSMLIGWAFHSDCQANLFGAFLSAEPSWEEMRKIGVGFWFTNLTDLRNKMEKLARRQYLKSKDPKACALLYIALNRLQVLAGLFKISKDEKDKLLVAFLSRNFQEEKHKAAALKNAYVLMGRHQFELAIAFFLLGGDISSAITVCAKTLGDFQLALVICRLVEGHGGPSERQLISKILLPSVIEKGDYWLASILEWMLGNYLQSFLIVLDLQGGSVVTESEKSFQHTVFVDPFIGLYSRMLAAKTSLRNAVGERDSAILCRWAAVVTATAFNKCGLPLEALEWLSSSSSVLGVADKGGDGGCLEILARILRPSGTDSSSWLSHEVACHLEYQVKLDLALQYIMKVMREHPCWLDTSLLLTEAITFPKEHDDHGVQLETFVQKLGSVLAYLEQKFSLSGDLLLNKMFTSLDDDRQLPIGYHLLHALPSQVCPYALSSTGSSSQLLKQFRNAAECLSFSAARFVTASSIASTQSLALPEHDISVTKPSSCFQYWEFYLHSIIFSVCHLRAALMVLHNDCTKDLIPEFIIILHLCEYCIYFASAMLQRNIKSLAVLLKPVLASCDDENHGEFNMVTLRAIHRHVLEALDLRLWSGNTFGGLLITKEIAPDKTFIIPEDEKWIVLGTCLWQCLSKFIKCELDRLSDKLNSNTIGDTSTLDSSVSSRLDNDNTLDHVRQVMMIFIEVISNTVIDISSHSARQLYVFLWKKVENGMIPSQMWLDEFSQSNSSGLFEHLRRIFASSEELSDKISCSEFLAKMFSDPVSVSAMLAKLPIRLSKLAQWKPIRGWGHLNKGPLEEHERLESYKREGIFDSSPRANENGSPGSEQDHNHLDFGKQGAAVMKKFCNPTEIYRRNGELLEALCINSVEQCQAAVASTRKGISFFNWGDRLSSKDSSNYIWSKAEWPQNGWVGIDCRSDEKLHLGLGEASIGVGTHTRVGRDLTGGRAFGVPGYSRIATNGMGWGIQEDLDNYVDAPATLDNITASALASHPLRPAFLVGSHNTHIYLWEFGEEKAAATYGVLPAANVPPPYPLASITSLQWDRCGHRFANSASDGTVCTWQLEMGGRRNVKPTESSLCFNGHVSDICYVATSGSIIAAAGYSSNGVNVVIWDTLAPPTSSRASVMCHEGGACSIAVFDNDMGTSSVSPLIVTGGKGGDVGLHDFRYIATGKTKRHRHSNTVERVTDVAALGVQSELSSNVGDLNRHGMLWYIPKAHSGSITKITTIPNTSLFLTGSKDGDVKLWDAKRARLVFHWPKMHERHTFLQRSSQSFGGVTRAGVTDIQVISDGFLTCGGDGLVKLIQLNNFL